MVALLEKAGREFRFCHDAATPIEAAKIDIRAVRQTMPLMWKDFALSCFMIPLVYVATWRSNVGQVIESAALLKRGAQESSGRGGLKR